MTTPTHPPARDLYDITIQWITYNIPSGYKVIGTGYNQPEDVKMSVDGLHAFITERSGDLVKVALTAANRASATVVASGKIGRAHV